MRIRSLVVALLSVLLLAASPTTVTVASATATSTTTAPAPAPPPLRFLSYNLCGGSSWGTTYCTHPGEVTDRTNYVVSEATAWNSDLLFLTEICKSQFDGIQNDLAAQGYHGAYVETVKESHCADNPAPGAPTSTSEGIALFSKGADPGPSAQAVFLGEHAGAPTNPNAEAIRMVCADTTLQGKPIKACTHHPSAVPFSAECWDYPSTAATCAGTAQQRQNALVRKTVEPWIAAGTPVVLGGDFNASPSDPSMDSFYDFGGGFGQFTEVDQTDKTQFGSACPQTADRCRSGKYTYDLGQTDSSKIDYVFLSSRDFTSPYAATPNHRDEISDHGDLRGAAAWAACADPANAQAQSQTPCSGDTSSSTRGDFNGDGQDDLASLYNYGNGTIGLSVWLADGKGGFASPALWWKSQGGAFDWNASKVVTGDFNGDGKTDIGALYNYGTNPDGSNHTGLWTFTSTGTGLSDPVKVWDSATSAVGSWNWNASKIVAGDFNSDGKTDIGALYNYGTNPDGSNHTGLWTFTSTGTGLSDPVKAWDNVDNGSGSWNWNASKIVAGDFNGDRKTDISVLYNQYDLTSGWWTFTSTGTGFANPVKAWDSSAGGVDWTQGNTVKLAGNFSGSGKTDTAVVYSHPADSSGKKHLGIWRLPSTGSGFGSPVSAYGGATGAGDWDLTAAKFVAGDFNGDGKTDIGVLHNLGKNPDGSNHTAFWVFTSTGTGFADPVIAWDSANGTGSWNWTASSVVVGDFNGDGRADIGVLYNYGTNPDGSNHTGLWTFSSTGTGFANPVKVWDSGTGSWNWNVSKIVAGDFNGDGKTDIGVLYNNATNPNGSNHTALWTFSSPGVGVTNPVKAWDSVDNGTGSWNWNASNVVAGDFNGDGKADIGVLYDYGRDADTSIHTGLWTFTSTSTGFANPTKAWDAGTGGGNWPSAVLTSMTAPASGPNGVPSAYALAVRATEELAQPQVLVGDFNGDGKADIGTVYGGGNAATNLFVFTATATGFNSPDSVWQSNAEWARTTAL